MTDLGASRPLAPALMPRTYAPARAWLRHPALGLTALLAFALVLRLPSLGEGFWVDDAIATGIAGHGLTEIPGVLRQDGSPPLYYVLLHLWLGVVGDTDPRAYALSLGLALVAVPVAWWAGRRLWDRRTGWTCAALAATSPVLTLYSAQARMYTLVVLLSLLACAAFGLALVERERRALVPLALALAALLYTHAWGLFLVAGLAAGAAVLVATTPAGRERRALTRDAVLAFGLAGVAYLPWLPVLLDQTAHTAAPWSTAPTYRDLLGMGSWIAGAAVVGPLALAAAAGWASRRATGEREQLRLGLALLTGLATALVTGWCVARVTGTWAPRYAAVGAGPALLLLGAGLARAGRLAVLCVVVTAPAWVPLTAGPSAKSNVREALRAVPGGRPGDLVLVTQPELLPAVRRYAGSGPTYASTFGPAADPTVMDWRDALQRLRATRVDRLTPLLDRVPPGGRVITVRPAGGIPPVAWARLYRLRSRQWRRALLADPRFAVVGRSQAGADVARLSRVAVLVVQRRG